ncbi:cytochrome c1 [Falsirhodobacter halotolerans]|uniref:cytochrome c1 n=1 Tax=Falsirhodobacter halotolerans TaxID=1146892 RepID=UPI001FD1C656|nr:cytochrome c1 [Falsirhodobacter halotolerans]MCJ8138260.1 cytochrome c1 [Falsirhodobacter halotolerans]
MIRAVALTLALATPAAAQEFPFEGPLGTYDPAQLQRGAEVFVGTCAACHGLRHVTIRSLANGDGPAMDPSAMAEGLGLAVTDHFPPSALPEAPDLSLMAKAWGGLTGDGGARAIRAYLEGYTGAEREDGGVFLYENPAAPEGWVAMPPVALEGGEATDVAAFLQWAADPNLVERRRTGLVAIGFLALLAGLLFATVRSVWRQPR